MECVEDVRPKGTDKGGKEKNISKEEGANDGDQSNGNGLGHDSSASEIRNFLFQD